MSGEKKSRGWVDKTQLGAAIVALSLLMIFAPYAVARVVTDVTRFSKILVAIDMFYGIVFLLAGIAVFFVKTESE